MLTAFPRRPRRSRALPGVAAVLGGVLLLGAGALGTAPAVGALAEGGHTALVRHAAATASGPSGPAWGGTAPGRGCPDGSAFRCITVQVAVDHFRTGSPTWPVTFALRRGDVDSRGVLVLATGGPGSSGIAAADQYAASLSHAVRDHYDVVAFDQRGIGLSQPLRCDRTLEAQGSPDISTASSPAERDAYLAGARRFVADCLQEAGVHAADVGRYATRQAVEDLEAFRRWLGADRLTLYGESYGTEFQQAYAVAHPEHVAQLLLDGVVDPTTDPMTFDAESARAYSDVLATTLAACDADAVCAGDSPGSALSAYDRLAQQLRAAPREYAYPLPDGRTEQRRLTVEDLRSAAAGSMSALADRALFQRALNAAADGDLVPLARLAGTDDGADPGTGAAQEDPTTSQALFFAVECADRRWLPPGGTPRGQLDAWLDAGRRAGVDGERLGDGFYGDLPCLVWPGAGTPVTPPSLPADPPYPVLLLTADTDPNTPTADAHRVLTRVHGNTALVSLTGGPHVVFGWGHACVDDLVDGVITTGRLPTAPVTVCPGPVADPYAPAPPVDAAGYTTAEQTVAAVTAGLLADPGYQAWDGSAPRDTGCDAGGTAHFSLDDDAVQVRLVRCALTPGVPVDGSITVAAGGTGNATATLRLSFARLSVAADGTLGGTFRGQPVG